MEWPEMNMGVIFDVQGGIPFFMAVHQFESVGDIKKKVQKLHHIPISHQTFIFDGKLLHDNVRVWQTSIARGSRILLLVAADAANLPMPPRNPELPSSSQQLIPFQYDPLGLSQRTPVLPKPSRTPVLPMPSTSRTPMLPIPSNIKNLEESAAPPPQVIPKAARTPDISSLFKPIPQIPLPSNIKVKEECLEESRKVMLRVKVPNHWAGPIPIEADLDDTVLKFKKSILEYLKVLVEGFEMQDVPVDRMVLHTQYSACLKLELLDHQVLKYCNVSENHEIDLSIKEPSLPVAGNLKLKVLPKLAKEAIEIAVNPEDNVSVLRVELEKLQPKLRFRLPENGCYFFLYNGQYMFEDKSFQSYQVREGDTIETRD